MSELHALEALLRQQAPDEGSWLAYGKLLAERNDPRAELIDTELAVRAKQDGAWQARARTRAKIRAALGLSESDGVRGEFDWARFCVHEVKQNHAAVLARLAEYPLVDAGKLELRELCGARLEACLGSVARLQPRQLRLRDFELSAEQLLLVARSPATHALEQLVLEPAGTSFEGDAVLTQLTPVLSRSRITQLGLWNFNLGADALRALAELGPWPALEHLTLGHNDEPLGAGVCRLLDGTAMPRLSRLALASDEVQAGALAGLFAQPGVMRLSSLSLWSTNAGEQFWHALAKSENVPALRTLNADGSDLTNELAILLGGSRTLQLRQLEMFFTELSASAAFALLWGQPQLKLRCDIAQRDRYKLPLLRLFGKRFGLGRRHDCGTGSWLYEDHIRMQAY